MINIFPINWKLNSCKLGNRRFLDDQLKYFRFLSLNINLRQILVPFMLANILFEALNWWTLIWKKRQQKRRELSSIEIALWNDAISILTNSKN